MENRQLTLGSLFDGSGGFPFGGMFAGIKPIWKCDVEPFPLMVTHKRMPEVKYYGDVSTMDGGKIEPVDIITFGFPCVDCSVAGRRQGIYAERSGLFWDAMRVIDEMREATKGEYPKWIIFENVPGLLSSGKDEDFRAVLNKVQESGFAVDINIFDAQYMGTAQRRRRIYCVGWSMKHLLEMDSFLSWSIVTKCITEMTEDVLAAAVDTNKDLSAWDYTRSDFHLSLEMRKKLLCIDSKEEFCTLITKWAEKANVHTNVNSADMENAWEYISNAIFLDNTEPLPELIQSCFKIFEFAGRCIINSDEWSRSSYETAQTILTLTEGSAKNVKGKKRKGQPDGEGFEKLERISCIRDSQRGLSESYGEALRDFIKRCAKEISLKREGVPRYLAQGTGAWEGAAGGAADSSGETGCNGGLTLNDQGGSRMDVTEDVTSTLRATANHPPCIMQSAGFCTEHSAKARGIGYEEEMSPTLRAGVVPAAIALDYHPAASRIRFMKEDVTPTLNSRMGTGGNNVNLVMSLKKPVTMRQRAGGGSGGKGPLCQFDKSATVACNNDQTVFIPKAYEICSKDSNSMKSDNPKAGYYEADTTRTLDTSNQSPNKNQGGIAVVCVDQGSGKSSCNISEEMSPTLAGTHGGEPVICVQGSSVDRKPENGPNGSGINEEVCFTLNTMDRHCCAYGIDRAAFNQGQNAKFGITIDEEVEPPIVARGAGAVAEPVYSTSKNSYHTDAEEELANTLVASDFKDPPTVNDTDGIDYIIRRLLPSECAMLQAFPPWWCDDLGTENPTDEEIAFWSEVWEVHRKIEGKSKKPKTRKQIIKWLQNPHSDSAEYRLWGNGVCANTVIFIMQGIAQMQSKLMRSEELRL